MESKNTSCAMKCNKLLCILILFYIIWQAQYIEYRLLCCQSVTLTFVQWSQWMNPACSRSRETTTSFSCCCPWRSSSSGPPSTRSRRSRSSSEWAGTSSTLCTFHVFMIRDIRVRFLSNSNKFVSRKSGVSVLILFFRNSGNPAKFEMY